jgi:hypothetical protein
MRIILALLAFCALVLGVSAPAHARAGQPMMYELGENANVVLAGLIEEALRVDPEGNSVIRGSPCTTPKHFFDAIKYYHPNVRLDQVSDLPGYVRSLVRRNAHTAGFTGEYRMSMMVCEHPGTPEATGTLELESVTRSYLADEAVWVDPNTGEAVLAGNCSNVNGDPFLSEDEETGCAEIHVTVPEGAVVRFGVMAASPGPPSACWALKQGSEDWTAIPSPCDRCDWMGPLIAIRRDAGDQDERRAQHTGLYTAHSAEQTLRFPRWAETQYVVICIDEVGGRGQSDGWAVAPRDWRLHVHQVPPGEWPVWGTTR